VHETAAAAPGQRIVLCAKDRGCTRTRKCKDGTTECIPPPHSPASGWGYLPLVGAYPHDNGQPRTNTFHHPEKLLADADDEDDA
jgi:hypothetical protein